MPELPDVQYFVDYFNNRCVGRKIEQARVTEPSLVKQGTAKEIEAALPEKEFLPAHRRGKFMIAEVAGDGRKLVLHYGMSGNLIFGQSGDFSARDKKFARLIVDFDHDGELLWINVRKLGKIYFVRDVNEIVLLKDMGPEPLELSRDRFLALLREHANKNIKSFLMDQNDIAGIGNEYSNEILFQAGINPHRAIDSLNEPSRENLYRTTETVLAQGIATKPGPLPGNWLTAHKNPTECPMDGSHLAKNTIAGRSAVFCPKHQH